jgi:hypothetical protein
VFTFVDDGEHWLGRMLKRLRGKPAVVPVLASPASEIRG